MSPNAFPAYFMGFSVLAVGGILYTSWRNDKKRNAEMETVARTMGFTYEERCSSQELERLAGVLPVFNRGHSRRGKRLITGQLGGQPCRILDYTYVTGGGKSSHKFTQTVVLLDEAGAGLPDFRLSPESPLHRLAEVFGFQDIDFDGFPEFSKRYLLKGNDEQAIRRAFTSNILTLLTGTTGWHIEAAAGSLAIYRAGRFAEAAQIPSYAAEGLRIANALSARSAPS